MLALLVVTASAGGCDAADPDLTLPDAGDSDAGFPRCDVLAGRERPVMLGEVLAVGRDTLGVVYALDELDGDVRAFVSDGDALRRHRVLGSGSGDLGDVAFYDVEVEADPPFTLYLEIPDVGEPTFSKIVVPGRNMPDAAADGEELTLLSADDLADFTLENLPPEIHIEYLGVLDDGRFVVVTRTSDDWSYDDFRLFVGQNAFVLEREVQSVLRARDGGSTTIELTLDGEPATLSFPVVQLMPGPWTLEQGGEVLPIERLEPAPAALDGLSFFCR
jgi:hypothetical protein